MGNEKKERGFTMLLSDKEAERLYIKASLAGMTIGQLMESFAQDLICGSQTNGSDERDLANMWYDRCVFCVPSGFLHYTLSHEGESGVRGLVERWENLKEAEKRLAGGLEEFWDQEDMDAEAEGVRQGRLELEEDYRRYEDREGRKGPGLEEEIRDLTQWLGDLEALLDSGGPS